MSFLFHKRASDRLGSTGVGQASRWLHAVCGVALPLVGAGSVRGQQEEVRRAEVAREGGSEGGAPWRPETEVSQAADRAREAMAAADAAQVDLGQVKRVELTLEAGVLYDDNIFLGSREQVSDLLYRIGPELGLAYGDALARADSYLTIAYRPEAFFFEENPDENSVDHDVAVAVQKKFARLLVAATGRYQRTSGSTVDLGDRVERDIYRAGTSLTYGWGVKTSFSSSLMWDSTRYLEDGYSDDQEWVNESFVDYELDAKIRLGVGGGWGRLRVEGEPQEQDFQRVLVRTTYHPTAKLSVRGRAGAEFRQTGAGDTATPVFGVEADHQPRAKTTLRLRAGREVAASGALRDQNYTRTGISLAMIQKLGDRFEFGMEGGGDRYDYRSTQRESASPERNDDSLFVRPSFIYSFGERWRAEAWYQWRSNDSTDPGQTYDVNQAGMNVRFEF